MKGVAGGPGGGAAGGATKQDPKKRSNRGGGESAPTRSHAHLHPQSHPFAHKAVAAECAPSNSGMAGGGEGGGEDNQIAALRLRGLPFSLTVQDVLAFFAQHDVADRIVDEPKAAQLLPKGNGRPSGQAVVRMRNRADAEFARQRLQHQVIGGRYIEVFVYGGDEGEYGTFEGASSAPADAGAASFALGGAALPTAPEMAFGGPAGMEDPTSWIQAAGSPWSQAVPPWAGLVPPPPMTGGCGAPGEEAQMMGDDHMAGLFGFLWQPPEAGGQPQPYPGMGQPAGMPGMPMAPPPPAAGGCCGGAPVMPGAPPTKAPPPTASSKTTLL